MFVERVWTWSGRLDDLPPEQLDKTSRRCSTAVAEYQPLRRLPVDRRLPTRWEDLPESIQAEIIENLNARVQALEAEERAKLEAQKQLTGPVVDIQAAESSAAG